MKLNEYECAMCHGVFGKGQSDEEAEKERKENGLENIPCDLVCDDCYKIYLEDINAS